MGASFGAAWDASLGVFGVLWGAALGASLRTSVGDIAIDAIRAAAVGVGADVADAARLGASPGSAGTTEIRRGHAGATAPGSSGSG